MTDNSHRYRFFISTYRCGPSVILNFTDPAEREKIVKNTARLADEFHARNLPVIWVRALGMPAGRKERGPPAGDHDESWNAPDKDLPIDESRDLVVFNRALSCFTVPETTEYLKKHGATQVVITGLAAGVGVESTARSAFDVGYNVTVVSGAVTDGMPERLESALIVVTAAVLTLAARVGCSALMSIVIAVVGVPLSGVAMGLANVGNQAMLYIASPPEDMGVNSGFYRTASYLGGFVATGVIATLFSGGASDASMVVFAGVFAVLAVVLVGLTLADLEIPARS